MAILKLCSTFEKVFSTPSSLISGSINGKSLPIKYGTFFTFNVEMGHWFQNDLNINVRNVKGGGEETGDIAAIPLFTK